LLATYILDLGVTELINILKEKRENLNKRYPIFHGYLVEEGWCGRKY